MPKICYTHKNFSDKSAEVIRRAEEICRTYEGQGFDLTLRQLYYQFVSRGLIPNKDTEYKRLGSIINDARLAGHLDWNHIVDRTRNLRDYSHWSDPSGVIRSAAAGYATDLWADQEYRVEVWIEKDALVGVLQAVCPANDVPYFSCRGYTSQSEVWGASQRLEQYLNKGQKVVILHLGDHDPSGIDMTRDIQDRLNIFLEGDGYFEGDVEVERIALNMDQIQQYDPPPNPAKLTDARAKRYIERFGQSSWELDALEPNVLTALIQTSIDYYKDPELWDEAIRQQESEREILNTCSGRWAEVATFLGSAS